MIARPLVAVIGSNAGSVDVLAQAEALGRALARARLSIVCGGRGGVMEAAARGLVETRTRGEAPAAVLAVGILPGDDAEDANPWCDLVIPSGIGIARNLLIVRSARAVIAVNGSSGTLSELAFAWQLGRPCGALTQSGGWAAKLAGTALDDRRRDVIEALDSPEAAAAWAAFACGG